MLLLLLGVNCNYEVCTVVSKQICANGCYGYEAMLIGWETTRAYWIDPFISFEPPNIFQGHWTQLENFRGLFT